MDSSQRHTCVTQTDWMLLALVSTRGHGEGPISMDNATLSSHGLVHEDSHTCDAITGYTHTK